MWMFETREDLAFLFETAEHVARIEANAQEFDGNFLFEGCVVAHTAIDRAHAATAEEAGDLVVTEALANGLFFGGERPRLGAIHHRFADGPAFVAVDGEHGLDFGH